jgi:WD40 repeat protein
MSFENTVFTSNPNFKFKEVVIEKSECLASTYQFDCYKTKDGKTLLIAPYFDIDKPGDRIHHISLVDLETNEVVKKLEGHGDRVLTARYFQEPKEKKDYLISADRKHHVIVWDLEDGKKIFERDLKYDSFIYSVLLMFEESDIYAVVSTLGSGETFVFKVGSNDEGIALHDTKDLNIYFLAYWWDEKNKAHNIIQCGKNKILITQWNKNLDSSYHIATDDKHPYNLGGMVFKNKDKDLLITSATYGLIKIIDLQEKKEIKSIQLEDVFLYSFVRWNDQYILVNDTLQRRILVLDMTEDYAIKSKVLCPEFYFDRFIKKVDHPKYGESILSVGIDWKIKLFVNRNIVRLPETKQS